MRNHMLFAFAVAVSLPIAPIIAQPSLTRAAPAPRSSVKALTQVVLTFDEKLTVSGSGATLTMTGMPGMANHPDMKMNSVATTIGRDGQSIVLTSARPLPAGDYRVDWHATGKDKKRVAGRYGFSVV